MSAPPPAPTSPLTRMEGGKIRPMAAPTANPAQPPCWVGFSIFIYDLYLALLVLGEDGCVVGSHEVLLVEVLEQLEVRLGVLDALVLACVEERLIVAHEQISFLPLVRVGRDKPCTPTMMPP